MWLTAPQRTVSYAFTVVKKGDPVRCFDVICVRNENTTGFVNCFVCTLVVGNEGVAYSVQFHGMSPRGDV